MNILIVGSGAREHALAKTLARTNAANKIFCCGNSHNPGIRALCHEYWTGNILHLETVSNLALAWKIDLAIIGPEAPLQLGMADRFLKAGIPTVGPTKKLAQLETSKSFTRHLLKKYQIEGSPDFRVFHNLDGVEDWLKILGPAGYVIKADGLMGGKGVKVAGDHLQTLEQALDFCKQLADNHIAFLIEEKLEGQEFSLLCLTDGKTLIPMPLVQDHKRAFENDAGPNTGGMGSYSCADHSLPFLQTSDVQQALAINAAVLQALQEECQEVYKGVIYGSFMATREGIKIIEFNARFGDPEAINILSLFEGDFAATCKAVTDGTLKPEHARFKRYATVCKYVVPVGYPDNPVKNMPVNISAVNNHDTLYYASVDECTGNLLATGSRAIAVLGQAATLEKAEQIAEAEIACIEGNIFYRRDIGTQRLIDKRILHMEALRAEA